MNDEHDELEIIVPHSFAGSLKLSNTGTGNVEIYYWQGSKLEVKAKRLGDFKVTGHCVSEEVLLNDNGIGYITFDTIIARSIAVNLNGSGRLSIEKLATDTILLTKTGTGGAYIQDGQAHSGTIVNFGTGETYLSGGFGKISQNNSGTWSIDIRVTG